MLDSMMTRRGLLGALGRLARWGGLEGMEQVMGPLRRSTRVPAYQVLAVSVEDGFVRRKIRYEAEAGDWVPAWLLEPFGGRKSGRAVICLHQTTKIGKDEPAGLGGLANLHYARELVELGFVALAPDYPNFGEYRVDAYERGYASATMKGIVNHRAGVGLLGALPGVDPARIAAVGHSLGGHNALFLAVFDDRVKAVVTSCGFTSFAKYQGGNLKGWSHKGYMPRIESEYGCDPQRMPFDFTDVLAAIAPRAVYVNAPLRDGNFDAAGVDDCVRAVRARFGGRLVVEHPDCGHDFPRQERERSYLLLEQWL